MRHCHTMALLLLTATLAIGPAESAAQVFAGEDYPGNVLSFQDTIGTVVNPCTLIPNVIDMALDHEGRLLLSSSDGDDDLLRFDVDTQVVEVLDADVSGHIAGAVAVDLGDDIYVVKQQNWKGADGTRENPDGSWLGLLSGGVGPAEAVYEFIQPDVVDIAVRPSGPKAGNIVALVGDDGYSIIEIERTEADSFLYYGLVADSGMMPVDVTGIAINPDGGIILVDWSDGLFYVDEDYGYVWGFGAASNPGYTDIEIDANGIIYLANSQTDRVERYSSDGYQIGYPFGVGIVSLGAIGVAGFTPTPEGEDVLVKPGKNIEVTYESVTSSGFTTAVVEVTTSRVSPEGNYLPADAQLPGSGRASAFSYVGLSTDAVYEGLIQVDVIEEGSRLFYASGVGDTFRDFTVVGSIEDARGTIPRFSELPTSGKRVETGPTEVVLVEDDRTLPEVTAYKFWRLELAMDVPDNMPGGDPCPWEFIKWLQKYQKSASDYYGAGQYTNALSELAVMNGLIRSHAGWCIPDSSDDPLGNMVAHLLAHSKTLMYSIGLESGGSLTGIDAFSSISLAITSPARGECRLALSGPIGTEVAARIYSVSGRLVATVYEGRLPEGGETIVWNGIDETGRPIASGVYFARVESASEVLTSKVAFIR
ncbi:MAG: hypothetical protein ABIE42_10320 [Candidatus Eisenbacteria bacterium]